MFKPQHQRIIISLAFALLFHALMLLAWPGDPQQPLIEFAEAPPSLSVTLDAINIAAIHTLTKKPEKTKLLQRTAPPHKKQNTEKQSKKASNNETSVILKPHSLAHSNENNPVEKTAEQPESGFQEDVAALRRAKILTKLRKDLKQYFYYPNIARRNSIQGTVLLGFAINQTGFIQNIHIIKSSGHAILDLAAEDSMQQLHRVNWASGMLAQSGIALELPIIYTLME